MKRGMALLIALLLGLQPVVSVAQQHGAQDVEARIYLTDGTVVQGYLVDRASDLIIVRVDSEIFTFEPGEVSNIVTIESLGAAAHTEEYLEFPYISFLGGTAAFGLLSWLQFDRAGNKRDRADVNIMAAEGLSPEAAAPLLKKADDLNDDADTAALLGWGAAALAVGSLGVALIPRRTERRVFPALSMSSTGAPQLMVQVQF